MFELLSTFLQFPTESFINNWWIFPASILFSLIALSSGVSGALFFSPFFMLIVGLSPSQAIGAGLLTEVFGMGNGLRSYVKQNVVDYNTAKWLLLGSIPTVVIGALISHLIDPGILKLIFGFGLLLLGGFLLFYPSPEKCKPGEREEEILKEKAKDNTYTVIKTRDGEKYEYKTCWRPPGVFLSSIGGFITGLISAGLPEISTTQLIIRCRLPPRVAVATSVFVLAITAIVGASIHALSATPIFYVVGWSIPGVLIGGTIGTNISKYIPSNLMENTLGIIFAIVGIIILTLQLVVQ